MKPPDNSRDVLTWVRGNQTKKEKWQIDSYTQGFWFNAHAWSQTVLYWQELPAKPKL